MAYSADRQEDGRLTYSFAFAGRNITLVDNPGTIFSVESLANGSYEVPLPILLMATIARTSGAFCDVGANIGIYSVLAAKTKPDVHVYAFEPLPAARRALIDNLQANHVMDRVDVQSIALSDSEGSAALYIPDQRHGLLETSASLEASFKDAEETISVEVARLDSIPLSRTISVMKADIEGHEAAFLRGAHRVLMEDRPIVYAEILSGASKELFGITRMMRELGYLPFRMRPDLVILTEAIFADKGWNYAFIQEESMGLWRDCCRAHDIEILRSL